MKSSLRFWFLALAGLWLATPALRSQSAPPMTGCATSAWVYFDDIFALVRFDLTSGSEVFSLFVYPPYGNSVVSLVVAGENLYLTSDLGITFRWDLNGTFMGPYVGDIPLASGRLCPGQVAPDPGIFWTGTYKVAYGGPGQAGGSAAFQVRDATKINDGFDPPLPDDPPGELPWASVVKGQTSEVVKFVTTPSVAAQTELVVGDGRQDVEISPTTGLTAEQTDITMLGQLVAPTYPFVAYATIEARQTAERHLIAQLNVAVMPERTVSLGIYRVSDSESDKSDSPLKTSPVGGPSDQQVMDTLNSIYKQCGIRFRLVESATLPNVPFDANRNGRVEDDEYDAIERDVSQHAGKVKLVFALHGGSRGPAPYDWLYVRGEAFPDSNTTSIVFTEDSDAVSDLIAAHEIGHRLRHAIVGSPHVPNAGHDVPPFPIETNETGGALMQTGEVVNPGPVELRNQPGRWMRHEDWIKSNTRAKNYYE